MSYLNEFLSGREINKAVKTAEKRLKGIPFTAIAVRGNSGMLIGAPLAAHLDKNLIIVRKKVEKSHSGRYVENWQLSKQKILLLDDFIDSGNTIKQMYRKIMDYCCEPEIIGVYLYNSSADGTDKGYTFTINMREDMPMYRPRRIDKRG